MRKRKKILIFVISPIILLPLVACAPKPTTEQVPELVKQIMNDAGWYQTLWMRWTVTDWVLTLLAAGTAITAAVKNAFSSHNQAVAQATGRTAQSSSKIDKWVMVFAALTIIATTLDAKMHAGQLAERYRMGDLLLQDAIMDYRGSDRTPPAEQTLLTAWHQAQRILEGGTVTPAPTVLAKQDTNTKQDPNLGSATKPVTFYPDHNTSPGDTKTSLQPQPQNK